jgi:hypothetical protein
MDWRSPSTYLYVTPLLGVVLHALGRADAEAYARLRAAGTLLAQGRGDEASAQLERALAFFPAVGATAYEREAQGLLTLLG